MRMEIRISKNSRRSYKPTLKKFHFKKGEKKLFIFFSHFFHFQVDNLQNSLTGKSFAPPNNFFETLRKSLDNGSAETFLLHCIKSGDRTSPWR